MNVFKSANLLQKKNNELDEKIEGENKVIKFETNYTPMKNIAGEEDIIFENSENESVSFSREIIVGKRNLLKFFQIRSGI